MPNVARWFLGYYRGRVRCTFSWSVINEQSVVLVSASEGIPTGSTAAGNRFVGAADITVRNIAPFGHTEWTGGIPPTGGGVVFIVTVDWNEPLPIWVDITVLDEYPQGWVG